MSWLETIHGDVDVELAFDREADEHDTGAWSARASDGTRQGIWVGAPTKDEAVQRAVMALGAVQQAERMAAIGRAVVEAIASPDTEDLMLEHATPEEVVDFVGQLREAAVRLDLLATERHPLAVALPGWRWLVDLQAGTVVVLAPGGLYTELTRDLLDRPDVPWPLLAERLMSCVDYGWKPGPVDCYVEEHDGRIAVGVSRRRAG